MPLRRRKRVKNKIRLDTQREVAHFVNRASLVPYAVTVTDNAGLRVNAKSLMGMLYAMEFEELWCECEADIYSIIEEFVVIE